jgi:hypothetical protein
LSVQDVLVWLAVVSSAKYVPRAQSLICTDTNNGIRGRGEKGLNVYCSYSFLKLQRKNKIMFSALSAANARKNIFPGSVELKAGILGGKT